MRYGIILEINDEYLIDFLEKHNLDDSAFFEERIIFMAENGFTWETGSFYISEKGMSILDAITVVQKFIKHFKLTAKMFDNIEFIRITDKMDGLKAIELLEKE